MQIIKQIGFVRLIKHFLFTLWQVIFDLLPFSPLRIFWLRLAGAKIGFCTIIDKIDFINLDRQGLQGLVIGNYCFLGRGSQLDLADSIKLEDWVIISPQVQILTHMSLGLSQHPLSAIYPAKTAATTIKKASFIGAGSILLKGVRIGPQAVVGSGSVVTKNIPARSVFAGNPAKKIRRLKL